MAYLHSLHYLWWSTEKYIHLLCLAWGKRRNRMGRILGRLVDLWVCKNSYISFNTLFFSHLPRLNIIYHSFCILKETLRAAVWFDMRDKVWFCMVINFWITIKVLLMREHTQVFKPFRLHLLVISRIQWSMKNPKRIRVLRPSLQNYSYFSRILASS